MGEPESHVMQSVAEPPEHVSQLESQPWQRKLLSAYVPSGQALMHSSPWKIGTLESASHDVQLLAESHVLHVEVQALHVWPSVCRNSPRAQTNVHEPALLSNVPPGRQEVHPVSVPSLHAAQEESHAAQAPPVSLYLPSGQLDTHVP